MMARKTEGVTIYKGDKKTTVVPSVARVLTKHSGWSTEPPQEVEEVTSSGGFFADLDLTTTENGNEESTTMEERS